LEFRLLGPVEMWHAGCRIDLGHAKQRCVLAVLLMEAGKAVPIATLVDRVWGHAPPEAAVNVLYGYLGRLRRLVAPAGARLVRRSGGYLLDVDPDTVDVHRFRRLLAEADGTPEGTAPAEATGVVSATLAVLDEALALWHGTPFTGTPGPWLATVRQVLDDQRLSAILLRNEVLLGIGRCAAVVSQLLELVATHPVDERLVGQLMLALCRSGRTGEALEHYRQARLRLREQQGTDPGPMLREMHQRILREEQRMASSSAPPRLLLIH
jgi:DNA-binding SARP family transcriptional activator